MGRTIAEELYNLAFDLLEAEYEGAQLEELLGRARALVKEADYYASAAVRDARRDGQSWDAVAKAASVSVATARVRWGETKVMRRLALRAVERATVRQAPAPVPGARSGEGRAATGRASRQLAAALSYLHQTSGMTIQQVAENTELSRSYVSRILSVERSPSWAVVCQLTHLFGGDPLELRVLWENAQGVPPAPQDFMEAAVRLNGVLRGLHLAAGCPSVQEICELSNGELEHEAVEDILAGEQVPTWERTGRFVSAVGGYPADIRPQWEAVYSSIIGACDPAAREAPAPAGAHTDDKTSLEGR
ncbi:helix-turn-helix transcriptional regulator [Streptomyces katrae]|uniref:Helix-turn-helix transcriptional regulator n=1 Tax=Streptomyces katrae TaxID=68223 RepID=A0ABT7GTY9_9ACTN|nr:helix-turn-helix transcriptional regulator [Streptomyces katrae]MDK9497047.1 helix-turn-helix transcriptional regulator [Streptomyces katrae]